MNTNTGERGVKIALNLMCRDVLETITSLKVGKCIPDTVKSPYGTNNPETVKKAIQKYQDDLSKHEHFFKQYTEYGNINLTKDEVTNIYVHIREFVSDILEHYFYKDSMNIWEKFRDIEHMACAIAGDIAKETDKSDDFAMNEVEHEEERD